MKTYLKNLYQAILGRTPVAPMPIIVGTTNEKIFRPANQAKLIVIQHLLMLVKDDDMNAVFRAVFNTMADLGFKFIQDIDNTLNQLERENPDK